MKKNKFQSIALCFFLISALGVFAQPRTTNVNQKIVIDWHQSQPKGSIEVVFGQLVKLNIIKGEGKIKDNSFEFKFIGDARLEVIIANAQNAPGSNSTRVVVRTAKNPFTFFLRDVNRQYPIYIPGYNVAVTTTEDTRDYSQIETYIHLLGLKTKYQQIEEQAEESFESAAKHTRNQSCPTWLGISRDMRIFELSDNRTDAKSEINHIRPRNASSSLELPELEGEPAEYGYMVGRGEGVVVSTTRHLEDGVLPILHTTLVDEDIEYRSTSFVSLEKTPLTNQAEIGTDYAVADRHSAGHMLTKEQEERVKPSLEAEKNKNESTVLYYRCEAINNSAVPRYAWFKTVRPGNYWWDVKKGYSLDRKSGFSTFSSGKIFAISTLNGLPLTDEEIAILIPPHGKAVFEFYVPHAPVSNERATMIAKQSFDSRFNECKIFWKAKLARAAKINVPEPRINEMIQAGLLHLDLITYGNEPAGTLAPDIGVYSPIGTESSPIIQFYNSMGLRDVARRSLMFFLDKQHDDGMIQNFGGYMVETGAALWSIGEYYRYTKDKEWLQLIAPKLLKACSYLLKWRADNKKDELRGKGYGMIAGKVADPEDPFHQYMLNAYAYLGISRIAELLRDVNPVESHRLQDESIEWKKDIRNSLENSIANSPVVPLGDGSWSSTVPPWTEAIGLRALHIIPETFASHGTVTVPDALLGPLYLVFCEVLSPDEPISQMILNYHSELFFLNNAAFSQPYYSRHNWIQLKRNLVKPFLKTYYNTFSALADRDTYTFWEHLFQVSAHKTHEEAWFLMETRWMLYLEEGETLRLLPGIPRKWLEDGKQITLNNVVSYFGPLSLSVTSHVDSGSIDVMINCSSEAKPHQVSIRIPHPKGIKAIKVTGGVYDAQSESILIPNFQGQATIKVEF